MRLSGSILALAAIVLWTPTAFAKPRPAASAHSQHRTKSAPANELSARMASIEMRIAMLRDRGAITRDQALDLRDLSRTIERRVGGLSARDVADLELAVERLETRVRFAEDDARWSVDPLPERDDRLRDWERYERDHPSYHHQVDRYTGTPGDRWFDPFDDGL